MSFFSAASSSSGLTSPFLPGSHPYPQLPGSSSQLPGIASLSPHHSAVVAAGALSLRGLPPTSPAAAASSPSRKSATAASATATHSPVLQRHHKPHMRRAIPPPLSPVVGGTYLARSNPEKTRIFRQPSLDFLKCWLHERVRLGICENGFNWKISALTNTEKLFFRDIKY